jgi:hypothetical protein
MTVTAVAGIETTLAARFEAAGAVANPELPLRLTVAPLAGGAAVVDTVDGWANPSTGIYTYAWMPGDVEVATDYLVTWDPSGDDVAATEVVTVLPAVTGSWATAAQALGFTNLVVTETELLVASSVITLYAGVTTDQEENTILARDRYWLAMAASYQAVWMRGKPGLLEYRESHTDMSADGVRTAREAPSDIMLAPLAARALRSLSWIAGRDVSYKDVRSRRRMAGSLNEADDIYDAWTSGKIT